MNQLPKTGKIFLDETSVEIEMKIDNTDVVDEFQERAHWLRVSFCLILSITFLVAIGIVGNLLYYHQLGLDTQNLPQGNISPSNIALLQAQLAPVAELSS